MVNQGLFIFVILMTAHVSNINALNPFLGIGDIIHRPKVSMKSKLSKILSYGYLTQTIADDPKINTEPELRGRKATEQFKEELVARLQLRLNQKEIGKTDMEPELRGREVCQQPSGFMSSWLICSLNFDKYFPKRFARANRKQ